jgi:8-amino-7-oxononanoate synthase
MDGPLDWIPSALAEIEHQGRLRRRTILDSPNGRTVIRCEGDGGGARKKLVNWASNDYLGAISRRRICNGATRVLRQEGTGAGAARLLAGGLRCHRRLEQRLAHWLGTQDCLLTSTGYQANLCAITSLVERPDVVILDRLCHASLTDGARLSEARLERFLHNDVEDLQRILEKSASFRRRLVVVESVYSMDGDLAPLRAIRDLCDQHNAMLLVDEAHAIGVFGPQGRGRLTAEGITAEVLIGTCSKSLGAQGGFIAAKKPVIEWIVNRGRAFIFTTALAPAAAGAALAVLDLLNDEPDLPTQLLERAAGLRQTLTAQGWNIPNGVGPVIPIIIGDETATLDLAEKLKALGHYAPAIRPPTVPEGLCRLRLTLTLAHKDCDLRRLAKALQSLKTQ